MANSHRPTLGATRARQGRFGLRMDFGEVVVGTVGFQRRAQVRHAVLERQLAFVHDHPALVPHPGPPVQQLPHIVHEKRSPSLYHGSSAESRPRMNVFSV